MSSSYDAGPFGANSEIGVGFSDKALLIVSIAGLCMLSVTIYAVVIARVKTRKELEDEDDENRDYDERLALADVSKLTRAQRRARARVIMKQTRRAVAAPDHGPIDGEDQQEADDLHHDDDDELLAPHAPAKHLSRKERQRAAKAVEKENRRLFEEERRKQQQEAQKVAQKERLEREREEARQAEEDRRRKIFEKKAQEQKEQLEWETFLSCSERTLSVNEWIDGLRRERCVDIDDVATRFSTSATVVRKRIDTLVEQRRVGGVFEGARFIYLSDDELKAIAEKIIKAGSSSLSDVTRICNETIDTTMQ